MSDPTTGDIRTEADVDSRVFMPYLEAIGVGPGQVRAQRTFSLRLGRNTIQIDGGRDSRTGRLDYLVVRDDGRPLFVVELKGPREALTDDDRDQGISYARLVEPMAPLVVLSNGSETHLYDTITRERVSNPASAALIEGAGRVTDEETLNARAEALEHFIGFSAENVAAFSRAQREARMSGLRGTVGEHTRKYETDLYVRRQDVRDVLDDFLRSSRTVFALVGASGFGKTNEMCALAEELGERHVTLFFSGTELAGAFATVLEDEFGWHFSESLPLAQLLRRMARLADRSGRSVLIFIDAVDEAITEAIPQELSEFALRLDQFGGAIRLVVSAKPDEWRRFTEFRGVPSALSEQVFVASTRAKEQQGVQRGALVGVPSSVELGLFNTAERDRAVARYCEAFGLPTSWPHGMLELARDPFMLRMVAEVSRGAGALPSSPGERELVRHYVAQKLRRSADPDRAWLELRAVARALVADTGHAARADGSYEADSSQPEDRDVALGIVSEEDVRAIAELPGTARVADDLVAFGVLIRTRDRDGHVRLMFSYDRVRDYVVATHALRLPELGRAGFRRAASRHLATDVGAAALQWFLPYMTDDQWLGFLDAATLRATDLLDAYETLRNHLSSPLREALQPRTAGPIGLGFSGNRRGGFAMGYYRRESEALPRVCFDPAIGDFDRTALSEPRIPAHLLGDRRSSHGFWFLRDPHLTAASQIREGLQAAAKAGGLVERGDFLLLERVTALAHTHRKRLDLKTSPRHRVARFADLFIPQDLFPLDLRKLWTAVQIELGLDFYKRQHMRRRGEEALQRHKAAGHTSGVISYGSAWTPKDLETWRETAALEVDAGRDFAGNSPASDELTLLATSVASLLARRTVLETPPLPPADASAQDTLKGISSFEDGYSDLQLARLLETIFDQGLRAYDEIVRASLSEALASLLPQPPHHLGVLCFRRSDTADCHSQFAASLWIGPARVLGSSTPKEQRAFAAVIPSDSPAARAFAAADLWENVVEATSPTSRFAVQLQQLTGLQRIVVPSNPPPFVRHGPTSAAARAPVRAMAYDYVSRAMAALSDERLRGLIDKSSSP